MKKPNWILLIGLGVAAWYFLKMNKKTAKMVQKVLPGSAARQAASEAETLVSDVIDKTTFLPDMTTDRDLYLNDQKTCK